MSFSGFQNNSLVPTNSAQGVIKPKRNIGGIVADVTVEESHYDEVVITQHPVEKTADITDHAYPLPPTLTVRIGYSPSGSSAGGAFGQDPYQGDPVPLQTVYDKYIALKDARTLMEVQTGKRLYEDMLIRSVALVTDADTENALFLTINLQHVMLVDTQTVQVPSNSVQAQPKKTANTLDAGTKQAIPATSNPAAAQAALDSGIQLGGI
jgi:hypothetical protein